MRKTFLPIVALIAMTSPALAAAPVEVTRFHTPATLAQLGPGWVEIVPAAGIDAQSLETRAWLDAVARELAAQGLAASAPQPSVSRIAEVRLTREVDSRNVLSTRRARASKGIIQATEGKDR